MQRADLCENKVPAVSVTTQLAVVSILAAILVLATLACSVGKDTKQPRLNDPSVSDQGTSGRKIVKEPKKLPFIVGKQLEPLDPSKGFLHRDQISAWLLHNVLAQRKSAVVMILHREDVVLP